MALVLSRTAGERVMIGDDIVVAVSRINGGNVVLAISAPKDVAILREEIYAKKELIKSDTLQRKTI